MAFYLGFSLDASTYPETGYRLRVHAVPMPGAQPVHYEIPVDAVKLDESEPDDTWIRDVLVAALEAL